MTCTKNFNDSINRRIDACTIDQGNFALVLFFLSFSPGIPGIFLRRSLGADRRRNGGRIAVSMPTPCKGGT